MNVKMLKWVLPMLILPTLVASCSQDDDPNYEGGEYVSINSVGIGELQTRSGYEATDNFLPTRGGIRLFLNSSNEDARYSAKYLNFTCDGTSWSSDPKLPWALGATADWTAFFTSAANDGYSASTDSIIVNLPNDQSVLTDEEYKDLDLLVGKGTATSSDLSMQLSHILSKVRINFVNEVNWLDGKELTDVKIKRRYIVYNGTYSGYFPKLTGTIGVPVNADDSWSCEQQEVITPESNDYEIKFKKVDTQPDCFATYEAIVMPTTNTYGVNLYFSIDGEEYDANLESKKFETRSGNITEYKLYVGGRDIISVGSTLSAWEERTTESTWVTE